MSIEYETLRQKVLEAARNCAVRGPGYAQQRPVLDEVTNEFGGGMYARLDLDIQQAILTCWHDLFLEGTLSWGVRPRQPRLAVLPRSRENRCAALASPMR